MQEENFEIRDKRKTSWFWLDKEILASKVLKNSDKLVYSALSFYANNNTQECFPSTIRITKLTGLTQPTVIIALQRLENLKLIKIERKEGIVSTYTLLETHHLKNLSGEKTTTKINTPLKLNGVDHLKRRGTNNNNEQDLDNTLRVGNTKRISDIQHIVNYFFELKGWANKESTFYKENNIVYSRYTAPARQLLTLTDNSIDKAKTALLKISKWAYRNNLEWQIETVLKKYLELDRLVLI